VLFLFEAAAVIEAVVGSLGDAEVDAVVVEDMVFPTPGTETSMTVFDAFAAVKAELERIRRGGTFFRG